MKNIPIITTALLVFISLIFLWQRFIIGYPIFVSFSNEHLTISDFLANFSHFYIFHFAMNAVGLFLGGRILSVSFYDLSWQSLSLTNLDFSHFSKHFQLDAYL